jgi:hypothetical protein
VSLEALQARLRHAHVDFHDAIARIDPAVLEREIAVGDWTARDSVAHMIAWNEEIFLAAEHLLGGPRPAHHPIVDTDAYNAAVVAAQRATPWPALAARLDATVQRAVDLSARFAARLEEPVEHPWNNHGTIRDLFHGVCGHQEEHVAELRAWRARDS